MDQGKVRVLVTGAAGRIGSYFATHHDAARMTLRLMVRAEDDADAVQVLHAFGEVVTGNLSDLEALKPFCADVDAILHLAGDPDPSATWASVQENNITGTYHVFAAAKAAGQVQRVVYASSIHAVSGYPPDVQVKTSEPVNPGDLYGVSKCFGEALARYMAEQENVNAICVRVGSFQPIEKVRESHSEGMLDTFVSHRDLHQLLEKCLLAPSDLRFAIFHGVSDNRFKRLDISDARQRIGYAPQDDALRENPDTQDLNVDKTLSGHNLQDGGKSGLRDDI